jgi:F0F1-type ATP synthase membrane subunit b/b'
MGFLIQIDWERLLNTYGWPTVILIILLGVLYKAVWPRVTKYLDSQEKIAEDARLALIKRADKLEEREDGLLNGFKNILEASADRNQKQIELLEEIVVITKDTNSKVEK